MEIGWGEAEQKLYFVQLHQNLYTMTTTNIAIQNAKNPRIPAKTAHDNYICVEAKFIFNYFFVRETVKVLSLKIPIIQRIEEGNH